MIVFGFVEFGLGNLDNIDKYINIVLKNIKKIKYNEFVCLLVNIYFLYVCLY